MLAQIDALVVAGWRESIPWLVAYIVMTIISVTFDYYLGTGNDSGIPRLPSFIYFLARHFVVEMDKIKSPRDLQHQLLAEEQKKSERVLPSSIA